MSRTDTQALASKVIKHATIDVYRSHQAVGDMWPTTSASDGNVYTAAGDNHDSAMNVWRVTRGPHLRIAPHDLFPAPPAEDWFLEIVNNVPVDPEIYARHPEVHPTKGLKPAGLLEIDHVLYMAVEAHNYGDNPAFNRQKNIQGWIVTSHDFGVTWNCEATPHDSFFSGRIASCHFLQFGVGGETPDGYIYAYFPGASDDGCSYWCNGDYVLLGRVEPDRILDRKAWKFWTGLEGGQPTWSSNDSDAAPVFEYFQMTGENHVSFNAGINRYIMGNASFTDSAGSPRPYQQGPWPDSTLRSELTLLDSPNPWGPWSVFHRDSNWGTYGDYQPSFPVSWMCNGGRTMFMVSSGSFDDYNFVTQRVDLSVFDDSL